MQHFQGSLTVEVIHGRKGAFSVGTLRTSIGDFKVEDPALDQFKAGLYNGTFVIEKIYSKSVPWRNGYFTNIVARIADQGYLIDDENESPLSMTPPTQAEPDPVDDAPAKLLYLDAVGHKLTLDDIPVVVISKVDIPIALGDSSEQEDKDRQLFGIELFTQFAAKVEIALDPTVDRQQFRNQRDRLKEVGYRFDAQSQKWLLPATQTSEQETAPASF